MKKRTISTNCFRCGKGADEAFLQKVKSSSAYVCEYCLQEDDRYGYRTILGKKFGEDIEYDFNLNIEEEEE